MERSTLNWQRVGPQYLGVSGSVLARRTLIMKVLIALSPLALQGPMEPPRAQAVASALPLAFVPNVGQFGAGVRFVSHSPAGDMAFEKDAVEIVLTRSSVTSTQILEEEGYSESLRLRMHFIGANPHCLIEGRGQLPGDLGYIGQGLPAEAWSGVPIFNAIVYRNLFPAIDLSYERQPALLKGTFIVRPHAQPGVIEWSYGQDSSVALDSTRGELTIGLLRGEALTEAKAVERKPIAWQIVGGVRVPVLVEYQLRGGGAIGFAVGEYDQSRELIIDPVLEFTTLVGDQAADEVNGMLVAGDGSPIVVGQTRSGRFPLEPAASIRRPFVQTYSDGFITKLTRDGKQLVFSRIITGSRDDNVLDIALDAAGAIYLAGYTQSMDFPVTNEPRVGGRYLIPGDPAGSRDGFVMKLNAQGILEETGQSTFSTRIGGPGLDEVSAIAVDDRGHVYATGRTDSGTFLLCSSLWNLNFKQGGRDAFVVILDPNEIGVAAAKDCSTGLLQYATYYGGPQDDFAYDIVPVGDGSMVIVGRTESATFPQTHPPLTGGVARVPDAFVARIDPADPSGPVWSYRIGGVGADEARSTRLLEDGSLLIAGTTGSTDFPILNALQGTINQGDPLGNGTDAYVLRIRPDGRTLEFSTYLGGKWSDEGYAVERAQDGYIYVGGSTLSPDLPLRRAVQPRPNCTTRCGFVTGLGLAGGPLVFSTYFGGGTDDKVLAMAIDGKDGLYMAGNTRSVSFEGTATPKAIEAVPTVFLGAGDLFVSRLMLETQTPTPSPTSTATELPTQTASPTPVMTARTASSTPTSSPSPVPATLESLDRAYLPLLARLWSGLAKDTPVPTPPPSATPVRCALAEAEPNDLPTQALGHPVLCVGQVIDGTIHGGAPPDSADYYTMLLGQQARVRVRMTSVTLDRGAELDLGLWACSAGGCSQVGWSGQRGNAQEMIEVTLATGTYFVGIHPSGARAAQATYRVDWSVLP